MGISPESSSSPSTIHNIYDVALYLGIGNQLTNILRDVGEDALRGRVYLPQNELEQFGLCDEDVMSRKISDGWREFMKEQIKRARFYFNLAEEGASQLDKDRRWLVLFLNNNHGDMDGGSPSSNFLNTSFFIDYNIVVSSC